jgi:hypothetical protein
MMTRREVHMSSRRLSTNTGLSILALFVLVLTGCVLTPEPKTNEIGVEDTRVIEVGADQIDPSEEGLVAHLEIPNILPVGENVSLKFTLKNTSDTPLYILNWYTPLEGIGGEIFRVMLEGQALPYEGILASRTPPTADAFVLLNPGESVSAVVDLAEAFDFSKAGRYHIKFLSPRISHIARTEADMARTMEELGPVDIPSNEVIVELVE